MPEKLQHEQMIERGLLTSEVKKDMVVVTSKKFDVDTGEEVEPVVTSLSEQDLLGRIAQLEAAIDTYTQGLADAQDNLAHHQKLLHSIQDAQSVLAGDQDIVTEIEASAESALEENKH